MKTMFTKGAETKRFERIAMSALALVLAGFVAGCAMSAEEDAEETSASITAQAAQGGKTIDVRDHSAQRVDLAVPPPIVHTSFPPQHVPGAIDPRPSLGIAPAGDEALVDADQGAEMEIADDADGRRAAPETGFSGEMDDEESPPRIGPPSGNAGMDDDFEVAPRHVGPKGR